VLFLIVPVLKDGLIPLESYTSSRLGPSVGRFSGRVFPSIFHSVVVFFPFFGGTSSRLSRSTVTSSFFKPFIPLLSECPDSSRALAYLRFFQRSCRGTCPFFSEMTHLA